MSGEEILGNSIIASSFYSDWIIVESDDST